MIKVLKWTMHTEKCDVSYAPAHAAENLRRLLIQCTMREVHTLVWWGTSGGFSNNIQTKPKPITVTMVQTAQHKQKQRKEKQKAAILTAYILRESLFQTEQKSCLSDISLHINDSEDDC